MKSNKDAACKATASSHRRLVLGGLVVDLRLGQHDQRGSYRRLARIWSSWDTQPFIWSEARSKLLKWNLVFLGTLMFHSLMQTCMLAVSALDDLPGPAMNSFRSRVLPIAGENVISMRSTSPQTGMRCLSEGQTCIASAMV